MRLEPKSCALAHIKKCAHGDNCVKLIATLYFFICRAVQRLNDIEFQGSGLKVNFCLFPQLQLKF